MTSCAWRGNAACAIRRLIRFVANFIVEHATALLGQDRFDDHAIIVIVTGWIGHRALFELNVFKTIDRVLDDVPLVIVRTWLR